MSSSLKMVEFEEDRGAAEARAIYRGCAVGSINAASKGDEVKEYFELGYKFLFHCSSAPTY